MRRSHARQCCHSRLISLITDLFRDAIDISRASAATQAPNPLLSAVPSTGVIQEVVHRAWAEVQRWQAAGSRCSANPWREYLLPKPVVIRGREL